MIYSQYDCLSGTRNKMSKTLHLAFVHDKY